MPSLGVWWWALPSDFPVGCVSSLKKPPPTSLSHIQSSGGHVWLSRSRPRQAPGRSAGKHSESLSHGTCSAALGQILLHLPPSPDCGPPWGGGKVFSPEVPSTQRGASTQERCLVNSHWINQWILPGPGAAGEVGLHSDWAHVTAVLQQLCFQTPLF